MPSPEVEDNYGFARQSKSMRCKFLMGIQRKNKNIG
jgi:hypothetical protein